MVDRISPLEHAATAGAFGAEIAGASTVTLSHRQIGSHWQIAGWGDFEEAAKPILSAFGFDGLGNFRDVRVSSGVTCYRIAPDRLWLMAEDHDSLGNALARAPSDRLAVLDLSHARCAIGISGAASTDLLARVALLDFSEASFPDGGFAQTGIHGVSVLIHRQSSDGFDIYVPVTWAVSVWEWLCVNAAPLGYRVETAAA